ncbi:MAG: hypothetical protein AABY22_08845 [Nanoarchaeota archaeon]
MKTKEERKQEAWKEYEKIRESAWKEYKKIEELAWKEFLGEKLNSIKSMGGIQNAKNT